MRRKKAKTAGSSRFELVAKLLGYGSFDAFIRSGEMTAKAWEFRRLVKILEKEGK